MVYMRELYLTIRDLISVASDQLDHQLKLQIGILYCSLRLEYPELLVAAPDYAGLYVLEYLKLDGLMGVECMHWNL